MPSVCSCINKTWHYKSAESQVADDVVSYAPFIILETVTSWAWIGQLSQA